MKILWKFGKRTMLTLRATACQMRPAHTAGNQLKVTSHRLRDWPGLHFPLVTLDFQNAKLNFFTGVYLRMTNKITQSLLVLAVSGLMVVGSSSAQAQNTSGAGAGQVDPGHPRVNQVNGRETNQQNRIANGVKNGQLRPGQTARLEHGEQRLQNNEKRDMAKDNGHLTKQNQRQLNHEANNMSRRVYKDKHSGK
ncbi:MAG: hypothetical protein WCF26_17950 [Candidatus Sulfotelmatobacter sp.]